METTSLIDDNLQVSQQMVIFSILGVNIVYVKRQNEYFNVLCTTVMYSYMELHRNTIYNLSGITHVRSLQSQIWTS